MMVTHYPTLIMDITKMYRKRSIKTVLASFQDISLRCISLSIEHRAVSR